MKDCIETNNSEWHLEQYKMLRTEIMSNVEEVRKLEIYAIGAIAAIYSWYITRTALPSRAWLIALLIPLLGGLRSYSLYKRIDLLSEYLREIEKDFFKNEDKLIGWEMYHQAKNLEAYKKHGVSFSCFIFWLTLLTITILAPSVLVNEFPITEVIMGLIGK